MTFFYLHIFRLICSKLALKCICINYDFYSFMEITLLLVGYLTCIIECYVLNSRLNLFTVINSYITNDKNR